MLGKRYTTEQKIRILREAEGSGMTVMGVCRGRQISEQTFHRWKREFGMLEVDQAKQLKELKKENARLKRMLADEMLIWADGGFSGEAFTRIAKRLG